MSWQSGLCDCYANMPICTYHTEGCFSFQICLQTRPISLRRHILNIKTIIDMRLFVGLITYFLPCVQFGLNAQRIKNGSGGTCFAWGCGWIFLSWLACFPAAILAMVLRGEIRSKFKIRGTGCNDCCAHFWCPCCAISQEGRELTNMVHDPKAELLIVQTMPAV